MTPSSWERHVGSRAHNWSKSIHLKDMVGKLSTWVRAGRMASPPKQDAVLLLFYINWQFEAEAACASLPVLSDIELTMRVQTFSEVPRASGPD
jgi:hypothetical protein